MRGIVVLVLVSFCFASPWVCGFQYQNSLAASYHLGFVDASLEGSTEDLNDISTRHLLIHYDRYLGNRFAVGISYLDGDSSDFTSFTDVFTDSYVKYNSLALTAKTLFPISDFNAIYLGVKASDYDYDVIDDNRRVAVKDARGHGASIGWKYQWCSGVGMDVVFLEYEKFGSELAIRSSAVGVSVNF